MDERPCYELNYREEHGECADCRAMFAALVEALRAIAGGQGLALAYAQDNGIEISNVRWARQQAIARHALAAMGG